MKKLFSKKIKINIRCNEQELKNAKKAASVAWDNEDYCRFIEIFEPVFDSLSPLDKKKIEYACKHL